MLLHLASRVVQVDVPGDNNCQIHALVDQLDQLRGAHTYAFTVQNDCIDWLYANANKYMEVRYTLCHYTLCHYTLCHLHCATIHCATIHCAAIHCALFTVLYSLCFIHCALLID